MDLIDELLQPRREFFRRGNCGQIDRDALANYEFIGELALTGELRAVDGALPAAISASLIHCSPNAAYAGSGFKDFTSYIKKPLYQTDFNDKFVDNAKSLMQHLKAKDHKNSIDFMGAAAGFYVKFKNEI